MLAMAASCGLAFASASVEGMTVAMVVLAVASAIVSSAAPATVARFFGRAHHGAIRASVSRAAVIGTGLGPLCTGLSAHITGGYQAATATFALACVPVALVAGTLRAPARDLAR